jgi:DNA polymerase-4
MEAYSAASKAVFEIFSQTTPFVEGISIDEAFLEVGGLRRIAGTPTEIAQQLRTTVRTEVGLPISVGIATTKFLAKVASAVGKPDGLLVVPAGGELEFLHALPIERLWGVGPKTSEKLHHLGLVTVGDLAATPRTALTAAIGASAAAHLHALASNKDPRPVQIRRRRRSIGSQRALGRRQRTPEELDATLRSLVERVARRLRDGDRVTRTVVLRFRYQDFTRATRSHTLDEPTAATEQLLNVARKLMAAEQTTVATRGLTLIGVTLSNLDNDASVQMTLPFDDHQEERLDTVIDEVRAKFGNTAVSRATLLGAAPGISMPTLPDRAT